MTAMRNTRARETSTGGPRHRRLAARSVIASTLLGLQPPELRTPALVAGAELLGVSPGTARVAISRMVAAGELEPTADGYRLAGPLLQRQARQLLSRRGAQGDERWDGTWHTAVVPAEARSADHRAELRRAMTALRHAELRDGVWLRPANLPAGTLRWAEQVARDQTVSIVGTVDDGRVLASRLWDLGAWADEARTLVAELRPLQRRLDRSEEAALAEAFVLAAAVLRHLQADPLLPSALLPRRWPGTDLRAAHDRFDSSFRSVLRDWHLARR